MERPHVAILCSGVALGVYIPGLEIARGLREFGIDARVHVLEAFQPEDIEAALLRTREQHRNHFRAVQLSQRLVRDISPSLDRAALARLADAFDARGVSRILALSGFWLPWAAAYGAHRPECSIEALHIDSTISPSWRPYANGDEMRRVAHRSMLDAATGRVSFRLRIGGLDPLPYAEREAAVLLHGGGWGVGTYAAALERALSAGYRASIVRHVEAEMTPMEGVRNLLLDPQWRAWRDTGPEELGHFPPLGSIEADTGEIRFRQSEHYPDLFDITRNVLAVVSKPGGSTLIDSMAAATPLLFLSPSGKHEQANADVWIARGYGDWFERWDAQGASRTALEEMHARLMRDRPGLPDYVRTLATELGRG